MRRLLCRSMQIMQLQICNLLRSLRSTSQLHKKKGELHIMSPRDVLRYSPVTYIGQPLSSIQSLRAKALSVKPLGGSGKVLCYTMPCFVNAPVLCYAVLHHIVLCCTYIFAGRIHRALPYHILQIPSYPVPSYTFLCFAKLTSRICL